MQRKPATLLLHVRHPHPAAVVCVLHRQRGAGLPGHSLRNVLPRGRQRVVRPCVPTCFKLVTGAQQAERAQQLVFGTCYKRAKRCAKRLPWRPTRGKEWSLGLLERPKASPCCIPAGPSCSGGWGQLCTRLSRQSALAASWASVTVCHTCVSACCAPHEPIFFSSCQDIQTPCGLWHVAWLLLKFPSCSCVPHLGEVGEGGD